MRASGVRLPGRDRPGAAERLVHLLHRRDLAAEAPHRVPERGGLGALGVGLEHDESERLDLVQQGALSRLEPLQAGLGLSQTTEALRQGAHLQSIVLDLRAGGGPDLRTRELLLQRSR